MIAISELYNKSVNKFEIIKIVISFINLILATTAYVNINDFSIVKILSIFSIFLFLILCLLEKKNILFFARTFILGLIGYFPILIKILLGENALFSSYETTTQGIRIVILMYVITSYALFSNTIGLVLGSLNRSLTTLHSKNIESREKYWFLAYIISIPLVIITAYLFTKSFGENIFVSGYGSSDLATDTKLGSINSIGITALYLVFIAGLKFQFKYWKIIFILLVLYFIIYSQLLHGGRQDAMTPLFGLVIIWGLTKKKTIKLKLSILPLVIIAYIFFEAWGLLRANIQDFNLSFFVNIIPNMFNGDIVRFGTVSPISTTFANTVWLVDSKTIDLSIGKSYFEYILRTPPEFLYPNRPIDYSWIFEKYNLQTGGGFYELGEVYMNFGLIGALFVPGVISFYIAKSFQLAYKKQTIFSYLMLSSFLSVFLRGTWYQTFAFYRGFLVCLTFYFIIVVLTQIFTNDNNKTLKYK